MLPFRNPEALFDGEAGQIYSPHNWSICLPRSPSRLSDHVSQGGQGEKDRLLGSGNSRRLGEDAVWYT